MGQLLLAATVALLLIINVLQGVYGVVVIAVVSGRSMYPLLRTGDIVFVIPRQLAGGINVGDVVVYRDQANELIIHRVIDVEQCGELLYFRVKGDNNPIEDIFKYTTCPHNNDVRGIPEEWIVGKVLSLGNDLVVKIPYLGLLKVSGFRVFRVPGVG